LPSSHYLVFAVDDKGKRQTNLNGIVARGAFKILLCTWETGLITAAVKMF